MFHLCPFFCLEEKCVNFMSAHQSAVQRCSFSFAEIEAVLIRICLVGGTSDNTWLGQSGYTTKGSNNEARESN